jgi:hypothetical protein
MVQRERTTPSRFWKGALGEATVPKEEREKDAIDEETTLVFFENPFRVYHDIPPSVL